MLSLLTIAAVTIGARPRSWVPALSVPWHSRSWIHPRARTVQKTAHIPFFPLLSYLRLSPHPYKLSHSIIFLTHSEILTASTRPPLASLLIRHPSGRCPVRRIHTSGQVISFFSAQRNAHKGLCVPARMPSLSPHLFMTLSSTVILDYFLFVAVVLSSLCVEGAGAAPVSLPWVAGEGLVRRATGGGSSTTSGMNRQVAHGLSFALIIAAVLIGLVVLARRSQTWHRQRHGSPPRIPPFLRDRPSSGSIPVIMSPRTAAIVAKDPSAYGAPPSDHAMPHWTGHFHSMEPLTPPPPAYSAATSPVNNDKALQRV